MDRYRQFYNSDEVAVIRQLPAFDRAAPSRPVGRTKAENRSTPGTASGSKQHQTALKGDDDGAGKGHVSSSKNAG